MKKTGNDGTPWEKLSSSVLAEAIRQSSDKTKKELAENLRKML